MKLEGLVKLEVYKYKKYSVLCMVQVKPLITRNYKQTSKPLYRWFDCNIFQKPFECELHRIFDELDWSIKEHKLYEKFLLNSFVEVELNSTRKLIDSSRYYLDCLGIQPDDITLALTCHVQSIDTTSVPKVQRSPSNSSSQDGYNPLKDRNICYEPYTPSKKMGDCGNAVDRYSPAPVRDGVNTKSLTPVPKYKPMQIGNQTSKQQSKQTRQKIRADAPTEVSDENERQGHQKRRKCETEVGNCSELPNHFESEERKREQKTTKEEMVIKNRKITKLKSKQKCVTKKNSDLTLNQKIAQSTSKALRSGELQVAAINSRPKRSPTKTMRYESYVATLKEKRIDKRRDGQSVDDSMDYNDTTHNKNTHIKSGHKTDHTETVAKHVTADDGKVTPTNIIKQIEDKKAVSVESTIADISNNVSKDSIRGAEQNPSALNLELIDKLENMLNSRPTEPPPPKFDALYLTDMSSKELLATFDVYKSKLDDTFKQLKYKHYLQSYKGLSHMTIINILSNDAQLEMLQKCSDVYSPIPNSNHALIFSNGLLPYWIVLIFMDRFQMTSDQAIQQILGQQKYADYIKCKVDFSSESTS